MSFFENIVSSINSPKFYATISQNGLGKAFKYFFFLAFLLTVIRSAPIVFDVVTNTQREITSALNQSSNFYPQDLQVYIHKGQVSTNVKEPYFLSFPGAGDSVDNRIVIDTKTPFSATQFNEYKAVVWLTKDAVFYQGNNSAEIKSYDLSKIDNFTLNKQQVDSWIEIIKPWTKFIIPVLVIGVLIGIFMVYSFRLFYLLFLAFLIWILGKIFRKGLSYGNAYKIGLYAMTLGLIIETILSFTSGWIPFEGFPFMFTLISLGVVYANYFRISEKSSE